VGICPLDLSREATGAFLWGQALRNPLCGCGLRRRGREGSVIPDRCFGHAGGVTHSLWESPGFCPPYSRSGRQ